MRWFLLICFLVVAAISWTVFAIWKISGLIVLCSLVIAAVSGLVWKKTGFSYFLVIATVVWVGGCSLHRHIGKQREAVYKEVWKTAPQLERAHQNLLIEVKRLNEFKKMIRKRKRAFSTDGAKSAADVKIGTVDDEIERLEARAAAIIAAVEQQSLTNLASKVESSMQQEKMRSLESEAERAVRDAVSLREDIERGVSGREPSRSTPRRTDSSKSGGSKPSSSNPSSSNPSSSKPRSIPKAIIVEEPESSMRTWRDRGGHRVSARLIAVIDSRDRVVRVIGENPDRLVRSGYFVQLQRVDGKIIKVPIETFSSRDISFLSRGG